MLVPSPSMAFRRHLLLCLISFGIDPSVHAVALLEMTVNVIETFIPTWYTLFLKRENFPAKAAPKATLVTATDAAFLNVIGEKSIVGYLVALLKMIFKRGSGVEYFRAYAVSLRQIADLTTEHLDLKMLRILMALPVVLAAEGFMTLVKSASEGSSVTLDVFVHVACSGQYLVAMCACSTTGPRAFAFSALLFSHFVRHGLKLFV